MLFQSSSSPPPAPGYHSAQLRNHSLAWLMKEVPVPIARDQAALQSARLPITNAKRLRAQMRGGNTTPRQSWKRMTTSSLKHAGKHHIAQPALLRLTPHLPPPAARPRRSPPAAGYARRHPGDVQPFVVAESADEKTIADGFPPVRHPLLRIVLHVMLLQTKRDHHGLSDIFQGLAGGHVVGRRGDDAAYAGEESLLQRRAQLY